MNVNKHSLYGPLMMLGASICFAGGGIAMKLVPWNPLAINGTRNLISALVIGIYLLLTHHKLQINPTTLIGVLCASGTTTLYSVANKLTTAGNAVILQFTAPIWIIILSAIFLKKKATRLEIITTIIVLGGICCFFFDSISVGSLTGNICALLSGLFYGGLFMINHLKNGDVLTSTFISQVFCGVILSPMALKETEFSPTVIGAIVFLGVIQLGLAYLLFNEGTRYTPPVTACLINGVEPILNPIIVAIFLKELLTPLSLAGAFTVVTAIISYNVTHEKQKNIK